MADEVDDLIAALREHGARRLAAREIDQQEREAIERLLPRAVELGVAKRDISRWTGLSRVWIDELLRRHKRGAQS
jgi:hypothetical protein